MDILISRNIGYESLVSLLIECFPDVNLILIYDEVNDWIDVNDEKVIIQYQVSSVSSDAFTQGITTFMSDEFDELALIEILSAVISKHFHCATSCDASRVVLKEHSEYYSLLFESERVYLVDDCLCEKTGEMTKIVELKYEPPRSSVIV